jgi:hypothetical protein
MAAALESLLGGGLRLAFHAGALRPPTPADGALAPPIAAARQLARGGLGMLRLGTGVWRLAAANGSAAVLRELENKLLVFEAFHHADDHLGFPPGPPPPLAAAVRSALALPAETGVWVTEGLGYAHAGRAWAAAGGPPRGLLIGDGAAGVPAGAEVPLHTGMGLFFAGRTLGGEAPPGAAELRRHAELCAGSSRPGLALAAFEGLGFLCRNLRPEAVGAVGRALADVDPGLVPYFWHGVGRGLYFAPAHALPGATPRALDRAWSEPPGEEARRNALAGAAWALALVNLRHPEVVAEALAGHPLLRRRSAAEAIADGVTSALLIWYHGRGADRHLRAFLAYRPTGADLGRWPAAGWEGAFARYRRLRRAGRLEKLFICPD